MAITQPSHQPAKRTNVATRIFRVSRLTLHVLSGAIEIATVFSFIDQPARMTRVQRWSAKLLAILAVRLQVAGVAPVAGGAAMIIANHISWLDIFAINAVRAARFIAKSEIRRWFLLGWLCEQGGSLFLQRARRHDVAHINRLVAEGMIAHDLFAVFPEGQTTPGDRLLPFHASLLQPAVNAGAAIYPVAIRYLRADGSLCEETDYSGNKSLITSLLDIVSLSLIEVRLTFLQPIDSTGKTRREVARYGEQVIAQALNVAHPSAHAETASDPIA